MEVIKENKVTKNKYKIAIVGLGYVGLPLAVEFSKYYNVTGYDINTKRINELKSGFDGTSEVKAKNLKNSKNLYFTSNSNDLIHANIFIITVPTPVFKNKQPDLSLLAKAISIIGNCFDFSLISIVSSSLS